MAADALKKYFGYDQGLQDVSRSQYIIAEWEDMIYAELAAQRPVISFITVRKWYFHFR